MENTKEIINDEKLKELYHKLMPVVTVDGAKYILKKLNLEEIKKEAYLHNKRENKDIYLDNSEITEVGSFDFVKEFENPLSFEPTISDVLLEIPKLYLDKANGFEISETPRIYENMHLAKVKTYQIRKK